MKHSPDADSSYTHFNTSRFVCKQKNEPRSIEHIKNRPQLRSVFISSRRRPIVPGGCPPSIVGTNELNFRVRDGNGWDLAVIVTDQISNCNRVGYDCSPSSTTRFACGPPSPQGKALCISKATFVALTLGDPYGIRTHVAGVRGRSLRPLDQRAA